MAHRSFRKFRVNFVIKGSGTTVTNEEDYRALLQTTVTLISNVECQKTLKYNSTEDERVNGTVFSALPYGLTYGFVCAKGNLHFDKTVFKFQSKVQAPNRKESIHK